MVKVQAAYYDRAGAIFAAHVGAAPAVEGYGATPWRDWLICGVTAGLWFAVRKDDPMAKPTAYLCSLAQVKASLRAGY